MFTVALLIQFKISRNKNFVIVAKKKKT